jgi:hypothetical protein
MANKDQFDLPEILQAATKRFNPWKRRINRRLGDKPRRFTFRKGDNFLIMQSKQGNPAAHFFQLAVGVFPTQPLTYAARKSPARDRGLNFNNRPDLIDNFCGKMLTAYHHAPKLSRMPPGVQQKDMGHAQFYKGGMGGFC